MHTARRIKCTEEELKHINREAHRVHTSMKDEDILFQNVLDDMLSRNDPIYWAVYDYVQHRRAVNAHILAYLRRLYALDGFTGIPMPGQHSGAPRESHSTLTGTSPPQTSPRSVSPMDTEATASRGDGSDTLEALIAVEMDSVDKDDHEDGPQVDEDEDGAVTDLVDMMSNIAVVM